jgi:type II secretory pathway predicted ATPase ExeA
MRSELRPLVAAEVAQYVKFRLMTAGRMKELFTEGATNAMHEQAGGICRTLNKLAMLSLIEGADRKIALIDETIVNAVAKRM